MAIAAPLALSIALAPMVLALQKVSEDPYTNASSSHKTQVEPDTYAFGSTIVSTFQSGRFFDGGSSNVGWATSSNNGLTWTAGFLPGTTVYANPPGPYDRFTDPSIAYNARFDVWLANSLGMIGARGDDIVVNRSTDGGFTWGNPIIVSEANGNFYDKNWITCDNWPNSPGYGRCYVEWDNADLGDQIYMSTSTDGGQTWGAKKAIGSSCGLGGQPLAQPSGRVIVAEDNCFEGNVIVFGSSNGGNTWSSTRNVASISSHTVAGGVRDHPLVSAEVDASGRIYVVWHDCRFRSGCSANDIVMMTSLNGRTWTPVARIPIDPTNSGMDHFIPGIGVDRSTGGTSAHLTVTYYWYPQANCSFSTCQLMVGSITSTDSGFTWSAPRTIAGPMNLNDIADTSQGRMIGDYNSTSYLGNGNAVSVFAVGTPKTGNTFHEDMYAETVSVEATGPTRPVEYGPVLYDGPGQRQLDRPAITN